MKVQICKKTTYDFKDMKIVVLEEDDGITNVYVDVAGDLRYVFGADTAGFDEIHIDRLHENGYFDEFAFGREEMIDE